MTHNCYNREEYVKKGWQMLVNTEEKNRAIAEKMIAWYLKCGRDLPWRHTKNPYNIWISEIMLQQTQVETVKPYYERFIRTLPSVADLASADLQEVYKLWEGLGYYRRAAHLKEAAEMIETEYAGVFPDTYADLMSLKGIGMYTASAIASIAFGIPKGVVDGNTLRIIARLFCIKDNIADQKTKVYIGTIMDTLIHDVNPSDFNQGMMDLGAGICTPLRPKCTCCPLQDECEAFHRDCTELLPVNIKKVKQSVHEYMTVVIRDGNQLMMRQNGAGLLENLYGFVQTECEKPEDFEQWFYENYGYAIRMRAYIKDIKHVFTHKTWQMHVYLADIIDDTHNKNHCTKDFYTLPEIEKLPVSTAHLKVLRAYLKALQNA